MSKKNEVHINIPATAESIPEVLNAVFGQILDVSATSGGITITHSGNHNKIYIVSSPIENIHSALSELGINEETIKHIARNSADVAQQEQRVEDLQQELAAEREDRVAQKLAINALQVELEELSRSYSSLTDQQCAESTEYQEKLADIQEKYSAEITKIRAVYVEWTKKTEQAIFDIREMLERGAINAESAARQENSSLITEIIELRRKIRSLEDEIQRQKATKEVDDKSIEEEEESKAFEAERKAQEEATRKECAEKLYLDGEYSKAFPVLLEFAEKGDSDCQFMAGDCYCSGHGVTKDYKRAVDWYQKAADQGHADAQNQLGECYYNGEGVTKDYKRAVDWYQKAAEQGDADAQYSLGYCYYNGEGATEDLEKAAYWWQKAADQGHAEAQNQLGECYYFGKGVTKDYEKTAYWLQKAADQGLAEAQYNLGEYYSLAGVINSLAGVITEDLEERGLWYQEAAYYLFQKAADQGLAAAQYRLGECYYEGEGVTKNCEKAAYWLQKAADQGHAEAQCRLGWCYYNGKGVTENYEKAVDWYRKAVDQGHAEAQYRLGWCYFIGKGVTKDYKRAVYWFQKAADQGYAEAQRRLGWCYYNGKGVTENYEKAVYWYQKAADQGHAGAKRSLKVIKQN